MQNVFRGFRNLHAEREGYKGPLARACSGPLIPINDVAGRVRRTASGVIAF
jgi:hypothetical protein